MDPDKVHEVWPHAKHLILSAVLRTELSDTQDIEYDILNGDQLLWLAWDGERIEAAASTSLTKINGKLVCTVTACGGENMQNWIALFAQIEKYAKDEHCSCVRIFGRKGWLRVLEGYSATHVVMERAL